MKPFINKTMQIWLSLITLCGVIGTFIVFFYTFARAYLNKSKSITIFIDKYGEANIEMTILLLLLPMVLFWGYKYIQQLKREEYEIKTA